MVKAKNLRMLCAIIDNHEVAIEFLLNQLGALTLLLAIMKYLVLATVW